MDSESSYLVRYGSMGHIGRFVLEPATGFVPHRGQEVVIRTHRGEEVGEVLARVDASPDPARTLLLRPATAQDLENARRCSLLRAERFGVCERILDEAGWPVELIDVETLPDQDTTVIHYLGPRDLDMALLRARFRGSSGFDVLFEPAGLDPGPSPAGVPTAVGEERAGRCGDCNCSGGGCGAADRYASEPPDGDSSTAKVSSNLCDESAHSGCTSCGISKLMAGKRRARD
jgi:hypothetical protein